MFAISTRHCTVFKALSVLHDIDSLSFCCFFDSATKVNTRTDLEQKATIYLITCALTTTAAATAADSSRQHGYKAATAAET
jgi:hypothetical protein